jgi:hypothetical protein
MFGPSKIMKWFDRHLQVVRRSRRSTLAHIAAGAMKMKGTGVLSLGRSMDGPALAKHRIKRVDRFLANNMLECFDISKALFNILRDQDPRPIVLADWTDRHAYEQLVLSIPRDGRSMPFHAITVKSTKFGTETKGTLVEAELEILRQLHGMCPAGVKPIIVADRGFGNERWIREITKWGWHFVQRISKNHHVETEHHIGTIPELGIRRGYRPKDWGWGCMGDNKEQEKTTFRLVTVFHRDADEPWYIATNIGNLDANKVIGIYAKRWWTETMFRDLKNRKWGLGMDEVKLTTVERTETHFIIVTIAYLLLCAFGAFAEAKNFGEQLKANTDKNRALSLAAIGNHFMEFIGRTTVAMAIAKLVDAPT